MNPFQSNSESEDIKRKQEEFSVDIRRQNREEMFKKKRNFPPNEEIAPSGHAYTYKIIATIQDEKLRDQIELWLKQKYSMENLSEIAAALKSNSLAMKILGSIGVRKILSVEDRPPIQEIIDQGAIPYLIEYMTQDQCLYLVMESAWALTNIASGTALQTKCIIDKGVIPMFIKLLSSPYSEIVEQAIWAIGNIAGDSRQYRDEILNQGAVEPLVKILNSTDSCSTIKHGIWALSNLCRGRPTPNPEKVQETIPVFSKAIIKETDPDLLTDCCWALSFLTEIDDIGNFRIKSFFNTGAVPYLAKCLNIGANFTTILIPTIRTIGNLLTGDDQQTDFVISTGIIDILKTLCNHEKKSVRRECCWALSNITAGNSNQIRSVLSEPQILIILESIIISDSPEISREATWIISNATSRADDKLIKDLTTWGLIGILLKILKLPDAKQVSIGLDALLNIFNKGETTYFKIETNPFLDYFENIGGPAVLEELQKHPMEEVYSKALNLLETFYDIEEPL